MGVKGILAAVAVAGASAGTVQYAEADIILNHQFTVINSPFAELKPGDTGSVSLNIVKGTNIGIPGQYASVDSIYSVLVTMDNGMANDTLAMDSGQVDGTNNVFGMDGYGYDFSGPNFTDATLTLGTVTELGIFFSGPDSIYNPVDGLEFYDIFNQAAIEGDHWTTGLLVINVGDFHATAKITRSELTIPAPAAPAVLALAGLWGARRRRDDTINEANNNAVAHDASNDPGLGAPAPGMAA